MKLMIPFVPHVAHECLELHNCKDKNKWPQINKNISEDVKFAIQVNGKTRDIITIKKDLDQKSVTQSVSKNLKVSKFIQNKKIFKTIFVKNKIINYIIK